MAAKAILVLCAQALLVQITIGQHLGRASAPCGLSRAGLPYSNLAADITYDVGFAPTIAAAPYGAIGTGCGVVAPLAGVAPSSGGGLPITSSSPIPPSGIAVASDNAIEGILAVGGDLPFVSAVALEGALPTAGAGTVAYSCGDGAIGIVDAGAAPAIGLADGLVPALGSVRGLAGPARGLAAPARGLGAPGFGRCGCGRY